jgi:transcriptional regulator with XRE-family HTH domain
MPKMDERRISERLRLEIERSKLSREEIARESGVDSASLSRFVHRQRGLAQDAIDALALLFGLELTKRRGRKRAKS